MRNLPSIGEERAPHWLDRLASLWPGRIALTHPDSDTHFTYVELKRRADAVAGSLAQRGVNAGDRVAAVMYNGVEMVDLFFACGRLGAIFVPLNWRLSDRELQFILDDVEPRIVVSEPELFDVSRSCSGKAPLVGFADLAGELDAASLDMKQTMENAVPRMGQPWLILYTGGTTGTPKGAVLTHGSIAWNAINTNVSWGLSERDVGPCFTPMFHTGGWNVFTLPLLMLGGRVVLPRKFDAAQAIAIVESERPTILFMVPTMFQLVAEEPDFESADFSSLRWVISGGAPLPEPIAARWRSKVSIFKQGYGLTEVGPNNFATPDEEAGKRPGTVGRLTYFAHARIVDISGHDVPTGERGELLLAGPHMCAGYWDQPQATADAIKDGWFHTGDIARCDDDEFYYIVDRKKDMIITGGENVYPTEVETVVYEHTSVREVAVVGVPHSVWGEEVVAVVALKPGCRVTEDELREHTRKGLARYKVPKRFIIVDDLPKSSAGKIVRAEARRLI
ncbi:MAG TPA: long-chain fatty acid--CoA ligase [Chloroflexota bacterium]